MHPFLKASLTLGLLLGLTAACAPALRAAETVFAAPEGVTLQAKAGGRYLLYWDPIDSDGLMGYSVWLRRKGEKEFVRLSVPVKVGKEIQKQPMVSEAKLELKLGEARKDLEFAVVAEYEDGPSARSASAFSAKAAQAAGPLPAPGVAGSAADASPTAAALSPTVKADPYAEEDRRPRAQGPSAWQILSPRRERPLLTQPGKAHASLGAGYEVIRSFSSNTEPFGDLGLYGTGIPYSQVVHWERIDMHTVFSATLKAEWGLLPGIELWGQGAYDAEDITTNEYKIDGQDFKNIAPIRFRPDGTIVYLSDPSSATFGDTILGAKAQPLPAQPLLLGLQLTLPTGVSRFQSYLDWDNGFAYAAGTGDGVQRLKVDFAWGWRGLRPGVSFQGSYSPGATEKTDAPLDSLGVTETLQQVVTYGDVSELGVGYTIPWTVEGRDGALVFGALGRSIRASRWTANGIDLSPYLDKATLGRLAVQTGIRFEDEDQLELGVEALQDLPGGFETGGRIAYTTGLFGDSLQISGRLVY